MRALETPHRLADDGNGSAPTPGQRLADEVLSLRVTSRDHESRIGVLETRRDIPMWMLWALLAVGAVTMGSLLGLVHYARELVQHLPQ